MRSAAASSTRGFDVLDLRRLRHDLALERVRRVVGRGALSSLRASVHPDRRRRLSRVIVARMPSEADPERRYRSRAPDDSDHGRFLHAGRPSPQRDALTTVIEEKLRGPNYASKLAEAEDLERSFVED